MRKQKVVEDKQAKERGEWQLNNTDSPASPAAIIIVSISSDASRPSQSPYGVPAETQPEPVHVEIELANRPVSNTVATT